MAPTSAEHLWRLAEHLEKSAEFLVIDADTHATDTAALSEEARGRYLAEQGYYHGRPVSAEDLIREMDASEVDMALIWQNPAAWRYSNDPEGNVAGLLAANRYVCEAGVQRVGEEGTPARRTGHG